MQQNQGWIKDIITWIIYTAYDKGLFGGYWVCDHKPNTANVDSRTLTRAQFLGAVVAVII